MSEEFKVQWSVSLPPAAQYAKGHMLNLRGQSVAEVESQFDQVLTGEFIQKATDVASLLVAAGAVTEGLAPAKPQAQAAPQPQAQPQQSSWGQQPQAAPANNGAPQNGTPHPEGKQCRQCSAVLQFKQVTRKSDNRTFKFWSCPNGRSKGDGHTSEFAN
ncbi:MAG TPA: hypothetical protein VFH56_14340 [Acidimicrobiales bacterium]|nr:hypothetical protein [Acidimicrobiales bacterium]